jgi:hypothetical protein
METRILLMETIVFRERPDERNECNQWTLVKDPYDHHDYVVQEHVLLDRVLSGKPYMHLVRRMTVAEFLATDQPSAVRRKLQSILEERRAPRAGATPAES